MSAQVQQFQAKARSVSVGLAWNYMSEKNRKALLIIVGMVATMNPKTGEMAAHPNASFYCHHPWSWLPAEWQRKVADYLSTMDRMGRFE